MAIKLRISGINWLGMPRSRPLYPKDHPDDKEILKLTIGLIKEHLLENPYVCCSYNLLQIIHYSHYIVFDYLVGMLNN